MSDDGIRGIERIETDNPRVFAYRVGGGLTPEDLQAVSRELDAGFDEQGKVRMLLILDGYSPSDAASGFSLKNLSTQLRSLSHVERYGVVGAPSGAETMLKAFDRISGIDVRTFEPGQEDEAWAFVEARPAGRTGPAPGAGS